MLLVGRQTFADFRSFWPAELDRIDAHLDRVTAP